MTSLLFALFEIEGIDINPEALGKEMIKYREKLYTQEALYVERRRNRKGRTILLSKGNEACVIL